METNKCIVIGSYLFTGAKFYQYTPSPPSTTRWVGIEGERFLIVVLYGLLYPELYLDVYNINELVLVALVTSYFLLFLLLCWLFSQCITTLFVDII